MVLRGFVVSHPCARKKTQGWGTDEFAWTEAEFNRREF